MSKVEILTKGPFMSVQCNSTWGRSLLIRAGPLNRSGVVSSSGLLNGVSTLFLRTQWDDMQNMEATSSSVLPLELSSRENHTAAEEDGKGSGEEGRREVEGL